MHYIRLTSASSGGVDLRPREVADATARAEAAEAAAAEAKQEAAALAQQVPRAELCQRADSQQNLATRVKPALIYTT